MAAFTVRTARPSDADDIARAHVSGWRTGFRGLVPQGHLDAIDLAARAERWRDLLAEGRCTALVLERAGAVVGFCTFVASPADGAPPDEGFVQAVYLLPECWGSGAARVLLAGCEQAMTEAGFRTGRLSTPVENRRARRFYEKCGWSTDGSEQVHAVQQPGMPSPVDLTVVEYTKPLPGVPVGHAP